MHAEATERFIIRSYRNGDEKAILDLFARSFHLPRTLEHWRWKYQQNPFGRERISLTFDADARLVGHYSGYPVPFRIDGDDVEANHIGDTMTDPSVRHIGRGPTSVLGRTALHFYETWCDGRVAFNYGFNVANIQKFSLRFLRSDRVEPVPYRLRDLRHSPLPRISRAERWLRGYQLELTRQTGAEWNALFERVAGAYHFLARRDARYVAWRYLSSPDVAYEVVAIRKWKRLVGWLVFRIRGNCLSLGDVLIDPRHGQALEVALRHLAHVFPVEQIEGWFPRRPKWIDDLMESLGMELRPEPQDLSLMCVPFVRADAVAEMRESFYYTMGDSDLF